MRKSIASIYFGSAFNWLQGLFWLVLPIHTLCCSPIYYLENLWMALVEISL